MRFARKRSVTRKPRGHCCSDEPAGCATERRLAISRARLLSSSSSSVGYRPTIWYCSLAMLPVHQWHKVARSVVLLGLVAHFMAGELPAEILNRNPRETATGEQKEANKAFEVEWEFAIPSLPKGARAIFGGDTILVTSGEIVFCLERATGQFRWGRRLRSEAGAFPVQFGSNFIVGVTGKKLECLECATGKILWRRELSV